MSKYDLNENFPSNDHAALERGLQKLTNMAVMVKRSTQSNGGPDPILPRELKINLINDLHDLLSLFKKGKIQQSQNKAQSILRMVKNVLKREINDPGQKTAYEFVIRFLSKFAETPITLKENKKRKINNQMKKSELRQIIKEIIAEQLGSAGPRPTSAGPNMGGNVDWTQLTVRDFQNYADKADSEFKGIWLVILEFLVSLWRLYNEWHNQNSNGGGMIYPEGKLQEQRMDPKGEIMNMTIPQILDELNRLVPEPVQRQKGWLNMISRIKKLLREIQANGCYNGFWSCPPPWWW